jgi:hypothetical protein
MIQLLLFPFAGKAVFIDTTGKQVVRISLPKKVETAIPKKKKSKIDYQSKIRNLNTVSEESNLLKDILQKNTDSLKSFVWQQVKYRLQIIYTQVDRDEKGEVTLNEHRFHVNPTHYFYPASMVKLPICALSLQKLNEYHISGLDMNTAMLTSALKGTCQTEALLDSTAENKLPSMAQYIKKMLLVSDNDAYSRVYEFCGRDYVNTNLKRLWIQQTQVMQRFDASCNVVQNSISNPIYFKLKSDSLLFQDSSMSKMKLILTKKGRLIGKAHINAVGKKINKPKDFSTMNFMSLSDVDQILKRLIIPEAYSEDKQFKLTANQYDFLRKYMSMMPRESKFPQYPDSDYEDSYKKYLMYGSHHGRINADTVRIFNIVGQSYGFLGDCAYIVNQERGVEFFLSAVLYVNNDGVLNDGKYEYSSIGFPFLTQLGRAVYRHELQRNRKLKPDLFKYSYDYSK